MSKHTPGPWTLLNGSNIFSELGADSGDGYRAPGNDGWLIATVERGSVINADGDFIMLSHSVVRANARLIRAAPELLEALKACRDELMWMIERYNQQAWSDGSWRYDYQTVGEADAAIAKATEEER